MNNILKKMKWSYLCIALAAITLIGFCVPEIFAQQHALKKRKKAEYFKVTVFRQYPGNKCTSGYLAVNGNIICYTLERPWIENINNISSIPEGTYGGILRYDHSDHWRIELVGVPNRPNIQIHIGNVLDDTKGCILVGTALGTDLCSIKAGTSAPAYTKLKDTFYGTDSPTSTPDKNISVEITGH